MRMRMGSFIVGGLLGAALGTYLSRNNNLPMLISKDKMNNFMGATMGKVRNMGFDKIEGLLNKDSAAKRQADEILSENNQSLPI